MFHDWREVKDRSRLGDCLEVFPVDRVAPAHLDIHTDDVTLQARAREVFMSFPAEAPTCLFGAKILLHNPEREGGLDARAWHLCRAENQKTGVQIVDPDKCRWLPAVADTVETAAAVVEDPVSGNLLFLKRYASWNIHAVVAAPKRRGSGFKRGEVGVLLISQFSLGRGDRQEAFRLVWKRPK